MTPEESAAQLETLAAAPQTSANDQGSLSERSAADVLALKKAAAEASAMTGTNESGGPRSLWNRLSPSKAIPGSGV